MISGIESLTRSAAETGTAESGQWRPSSYSCDRADTGQEHEERHHTHHGQADNLA